MVNQYLFFKTNICLFKKCKLILNLILGAKKRLLFYFAFGFKTFHLIFPSLEYFHIRYFFRWLADVMQLYSIKNQKKKKEPVHYYTNDNKLSGLFNKLWKTNSNISKPWML